MQFRHSNLKRRSGWGILVLGVAFGLSAIMPARAADPFEKLDTAARFVPADAAFFQSMMRNREQFEALTQSNTWEKLKAMPFVQMGLAVYNIQALDPESVPGQINAALRDPEQAKLFQLVTEMASDEVFIYGDENVVGSIALMQQISSAMRYGPAVLQLSGGMEDVNEDQLQAMLLLAVLAENADQIAVPEFVMGFRIQDTDNAAAQIERLETLVREALEEEADVPVKVAQKTVADVEYLTFTLPVRDLPWDEVSVEDLEKLETTEGDAKKVLEKIQSLEMVVSIGVRDDYVLVSFGPSTAVLEKLGQGDSLLARDELKPLAAFADRRVTGLGYMSAAMAKVASDVSQQVDDAVEAAEELLPLAELESDQQEKVLEDVRTLAEELKQFVPEPGPMAAISFLTDQGIESYQYDWTKRDDLDGSKALSLLDHVGDHPILAVIARDSSSTQQYAFVAKWTGKALDYVETLALPKMDEEDRDKLKQVLDMARPLLGRADKATREMLLPALADGQVALVLDRKLESSQFIETLPETEDSMPMLEPAMVLGVSDADLLCKAMGEYMSVARDMLDGMKKVEGTDIPDDIRIPDPKIESTAAGTLYSYALPAEWGIDEQIVPNAGLGNGVVVLSLTHDHTQRLLGSQSLAAAGVLADAGRPRAMAVVFDLAGLIEAIKPWAHLAIDQMDSEEAVGGQTEAIRQQVGTVLEAIQTIRTITSETYSEGDALVTHGLVEIKDMEP